VNMGLTLFKRKQRYQGGSEAVPSELPTPPEPPEAYQSAPVRSLIDQVRQGILPDDALSEIQRDPTSLRSLAAYAGAALSTGTLLSGGGGEKLPMGGEHIPVSRENVDSLLGKYQTPDDKSRLKFLSDNWDEPYMDSFKSNLHSTLDDVHQKMADVPYSKTDLQRRLLTSDALMEGKPEDVYPVPVYVGAEGDPNTVGLLLHQNGNFEHFEGNDESTPQTLDLVNKLLGNADKEVRVYTSQPADVIARIKEGDIPHGIFVSPDRAHAASYWGEGRDVTSFKIPMNRVAQHSDIDWQVRPQPPEKYVCGTSIVRGYPPTHMLNT
jgi:hypothetical protein